jgi:ubiquinone/menaquinone biosynthesis C-methylase UbiE
MTDMPIADDARTRAYLATAFRDVDADTDLGKVIACLRFMEGLPSFTAYKRRSIEMLRLENGASALDIGCGLGFDVIRLSDAVGPSGRATGVDLSDKLLTTARQAFGQREGIAWQLGDGEELPAETSSLDAARVDRTLQHVARPQRVIEEMLRVLAPGGWAVCAEPDWGTFVIDAEPVDGVTEHVIDHWRAGFRNPYIGRQLLRRLRTAGFQNTWVEGFILVADGLHAADMVYDIRQTVNKLGVEHADQRDAFSGWYDKLMARDRAEGILASVTLFLAGGQKGEPTGSEQR